MSSLVRMRAAMLLCSAFLVACSTQREAKPAPDAKTLLQAIPAADAAQLERVQDMKNWRNPYLIVRTDGVSLFDSAGHTEIMLKNEELLPALARLPAANWPYGRVVAVAETGVRASEQDGIAIRRNRGIVGGTLEGAGVAIKWVP